MYFFTECEIKEYVITKTEATFAASKTACNDLNGEIASEDLKDRLLANFGKNNNIRYKLLINKYYDQKADFKIKLI